MDGNIYQWWHRNDSIQYGVDRERLPSSFSSFFFSFFRMSQIHFCSKMFLKITTLILTLSTCVNAMTWEGETKNKPVSTVWSQIFYSHWNIPRSKTVCWPNILALHTLKTFHGAKTEWISLRPLPSPYPPLTQSPKQHHNPPPKQAIPLPRTSAPDFTATAVLHDDFTSVSLSDYTSKSQWLVLFFYPFDYTFVCPTEIRSFSDAAGKFADINVGVAAVSTDRWEY